jgi:hypothetical protein
VVSREGVHILSGDRVKRGREFMPKHRISPAAQRAGTEARIARANERAADIASNARGVPTTWGHRHCYASQVARLLARLPGVVLNETENRESRETA